MNFLSPTVPPLIWYCFEWTWIRPYYIPIGSPPRKYNLCRFLVQRAPVCYDHPLRSSIVKLLLLHTFARFIWSTLLFSFKSKSLDKGMKIQFIWAKLREDQLYNIICIFQISLQKLETRMNLPPPVSTCWFLTSMSKTTIKPEGLDKLYDDSSRGIAFE